MKAAAFLIKYLSLRNERGWPTYIRDIPLTIVLACAILVPFVVVKGSLFFSKDGFLDKFSSFSGVLTGFYVAALIAVASIPSGNTGLDEVITDGPILIRSKKEKERRLTRRQYVCMMFGYLAFLSVLIAVISILSVSLAYGSPRGIFKNLFAVNVGLRINPELLRGLLIFVVSVPISHMALTTLRGLYYLTEKIYNKQPKMLPRDNGSDE